MASQMIDELYVTLSTRGMEAVQSSLSNITSGLSQVQGIIQKVSAGFQTALVPAAALTATLTGLALAGFQGTVEMQQLSFQFQLFAREIASVVAPVVDLLTAGFAKLSRVMQSLGGNGQKLVLVFVGGLAAITIGLTAVITALGVASMAVGLLIGVVSVLTTVVSALAAAVTAGTGGLNLIIGAVVALATGSAAASAALAGITLTGLYASIGGLLAYSRELRMALWGVIEAFGGVLQAAWPVMKALLVIGGAILEAFVIEPLIQFAHWLTVVLMTAERIITRLIAMVPIIGRIAGAFNLGGGQRQNVALNQTGEESASGTFQRIQQAALQTSATQTPVEANTDALKALTTRVEEWTGTVNRVIDGIASRPPVQAIIAGANAVAENPMAAAGLFALRLGGR